MVKTSSKTVQSLDGRTPIKHVNINHMEKLAVTILIGTLIFMFFTFIHLRKSRKLGTLLITTGNKDPEIPLQVYKQDIETFLTQVRYFKDKRNHSVYRPGIFQTVFGGKCKTKADTYSIELQGPYHIIKILEGILSTPASKFRSKRTL